MGKFEHLLRGDPQPGAGVGVAADHGGVDGHRDPGCLLGVSCVADPEQEAALQQVGRHLCGLLLVRGARSELGEVLKAERDLESSRAVSRDLVDHVLAVGDVVGLVDDQWHPRHLHLRQMDLPLQLGVQHPHEEVHARPAVLGPDRGHVRVDDQDISRLDDFPKRDVAGVVEETPQRRHGGES